MTSFAHFMLNGGWPLFSFMAAVFTAGFYLINQYLKQPGHVLILLMRAIVVAVMTPFVLNASFVYDWHFIFVVILTAALGSFGDVRLMDTVVKYGAGVSARLQPLTVFLSFFLWFLFDPALLSRYAAHPLNTAGIVAALGGCVWFATQMRRCNISKAAFIQMLPALLCYTAVNVLNKYAMGLAPLTSAVFAYMYFQSVAVVVMMGGYALWQKEKPKAESWNAKRLTLAASLLAFSWIGHMIFKNYAMAFAENPSYQSAINLTSAPLISLFYLAARHKEEADVKSGMGVVACAVALAFLTVR